MKLEGIIVEKGIAGNGIKIDTSGFKVPDRVPVSWNFGHDIGSADIKLNDKGEIVADIEIEDPSILSEMDRQKEAGLEPFVFKMYTAIGGIVRDSHMDGDVKVIDKFDLRSVSFTAGKNDDPSIQTIGEQISKK